MATDDSTESEDPVVATPESPAAPAAQTLPAMTPGLRRRMQMCHDHGVRLMKQEKYDFDYANTLLSQCVVHDPANNVYVDLFFENLRRKFKDYKPGGLGWGSGNNVRAHLDKEEWVDALKVGIDNLAANPWDIPTLRGLAEACANLQLNEVELRFLKMALDAAPRDIEINRHCAKSLARMAQFDQAIACWHRVEEADKNDPEATKAIADLTLIKQRVAAGIAIDGGPSSARTVARPVAAKPAAADIKRRDIQLTPRQQLERAISENPENVENYLELAKILLKDDRPAEAIAFLTKALAVSGGDLKVRELLEDAQIERVRIQATLAEKKAAIDGLPESIEAAERAKAELNRLELETLAARCERYPDRTDVRFEAGLRIKRGGQLAEAIKYFQEAAADENLTGAAHLEIGECYQQLKQYQPAYDAYKQAILATNHYGREATPEQRKLRKLALYRGGVLAAGLKKLDRAEQLLDAVVKIDSGYRDAASRLDKVRRMRHKE